MHVNGVPRGLRIASAGTPLTVVATLTRNWAMIRERFASTFTRPPSPE
jgi:hypothetical protein